MATDKITLQCSCGSKLFDGPKNPRGSDVVKCAKCGASSKYGDVLKQAEALLKKQLVDALRKSGFK